MTFFDHSRDVTINVTDEREISQSYKYTNVFSCDTKMT